MRGFLSVFFLFLVIFLINPIHCEENERIVKQINDGQLVNAYVTVEGLIERWDKGKAENTIAYELKDNWGDKIIIISKSERHPELNKRYRVEGYVAFEQAASSYLIMENKREALDASPAPQPAVVETTPAPAPIVPAEESTQESTPQEEETGANWYLIGLIGAVVVVLILLIVLLLGGWSGSPLPHFDSTAVVTVADHTQKITAPVAKEEAIQAGTVKILPGWFEVAGGSELKEIRLIRPQGSVNQTPEYTLGRLPGPPLSHIQLNDPTVSSHQAKLQFFDGKYILENIPDPYDPDRNATILNHERMEANECRELKDGDRIEMGHAALIYHEK